MQDLEQVLRSSFCTLTGASQVLHDSIYGNVLQSYVATTLEEFADMLLQCIEKSGETGKFVAQVTIGTTETCVMHYCKPDIEYDEGYRGVDLHFNHQCSRHGLTSYTLSISYLDGNYNGMVLWGCDEECDNVSGIALVSWDT
jgi:hypothetical protein